VRWQTLQVRKQWKAGDEWDPANPENKERTRLLRGQLRARLLASDPIGVADTPEAHDEYDCLLSPLMHHLHGGSKEDELYAWLTRELEEHFGLSTDPVRERQLAASLVAWWATSTAS
jgi:hypothetical protein